jgi:hypothetical protein
MLTITVTSIVRDMIESYASIRDTLTAHYTFEKPSLYEALREFVLTRECWHYPRNQEPALEVTFSVYRLRESRTRSQSAREMNLSLHYSSNPPTLGFHGLQNVVAESTEFILKPTVRSARPFSELSMVDVDYFVGPSRDWLDWDPVHTCFRGRVPPKIASVAGVQRQDVYTMPLEITASITKVFPGGIRYENVIRCALPLTVKRRPDDCGPIYERVSHPSPVRSLLSIPGLTLPPPMNVEVRMMRDFTHSSGPGQEFSPEWKHYPTTPRVQRLRGKAKTPLGPRAPNIRDDTRELGSTHIDKRGDLASDSERGTPEPTPKAVPIHLSPQRLRASDRSAKRQVSSEELFHTIPSREKGQSLKAARTGLSGSVEDASMESGHSAVDSSLDPSVNPVDPLQFLHQCLDDVFTQKDPAQWDNFYRHMQRFSPTGSSTPSKVPVTSTFSVSNSAPRTSKQDRALTEIKRKPLNRRAILHSRSPSQVDSARDGRSPPSSHDDVEPLSVDQWQREIQRNFAEFKEHQREFSEGIDTKMADAEAWTDSELVLPE